MAKLGIEVEGRFCGLFTLFINADEYFNLAEVFDRIRANPDVALANIEQIYISDHEGRINLQTTNQDLVELCAGHQVTVECKYVPQFNIIEHLNIMLSIDCNQVWYLRKNDQIKFSMGQHVMATTVRNMTQTAPADFDGDINV